MGPHYYHQLQKQTYMYQSHIESPYYLRPPPSQVNIAPILNPTSQQPWLPTASSSQDRYKNVVHGYTKTQQKTSGQTETRQWHSSSVSEVSISPTSQPGKADRKTHILRRNRQPGRKKENNCHERVPPHRNHIHHKAPPPQIPRPFFKSPVQHLADDGDQIRDIQGNSADVEHGTDCRVGH